MGEPTTLEGWEEEERNVRQMLATEEYSNNPEVKMYLGHILVNRVLRGSNDDRALHIKLLEEASDTLDAAIKCGGGADPQLSITYASVLNLSAFYETDRDKVIRIFDRAKVYGNQAVTLAQARMHQAPDLSQYQINTAQDLLQALDGALPFWENVQQTELQAQTQSRRWRYALLLGGLCAVAAVAAMALKKYRK